MIFKNYKNNPITWISQDKRISKHEHIAIEGVWNQGIWWSHRPSQRWDWRPWSSEKPWLMNSLYPNEVIREKIEYGERKEKQKIEATKKWWKWRVVVGGRNLRPATPFLYLKKLYFFFPKLSFFFLILPLSSPFIYSFAMG